VGFHKIITVALALWFFLAQRAIAQTIPCASLALPSSGQPSTTVSDPVSGTVIMRVQVSKSGLIHDIEIFSDPSTLAVSAIEAVKRWKYKPAYWVTGPLTDRYTFLSVALKKGAALMIAEVEQSVPSGVGCVASPALDYDRIAIAWILNSISPQIPRLALPSREAWHYPDDRRAISFQEPPKPYHARGLPDGVVGVLTIYRSPGFRFSQSKRGALAF
jgi:hypothetical protein